MCILLNSNEDLLFSGTMEDKHDNYVIALSLNQSETQLVSCASSDKLIIILEKREYDEFEFKYFVKQTISDFGFKIKFIKDNQFIGQLVVKKQLISLYLNQKKDNFKKIKRIQLNNQILNYYSFPLVYNKERNLIVVIYKTYFDIIREMNQGKFKIVDQLNCETFRIFGIIANNGQYLVYWDEKNEGYSTQELFNN
ncbi:unnamed protein product [Paramecium pentaurelia]|uniref:Uncharacterized protein n=1 Tax=Paramecium pentaurelia TaxID=43138 RepID=A0A8S1XWF7_9CILI|nr:unnamed protein product [Paramecium pentaurelia]